MHRILMCEPRYYEIAYEINPWMNREKAASHTLAVSQWQSLKKLIENCGATVELVEPVPGWPDLVFTANAGLILANRVIVSHFMHPERQGERPYYKSWFEKAGFEVILDPEQYPFEGAGDALFAGNKLFLAHGFRSDPKVVSLIKTLGDFKVIECQLVDSYFYHIDTCFCPLNDKQAIWWPGAFASSSQKKLAEEIELHAIPEADAKKFACNAVVIDQNVIIPSGCDATEALLKQLGFTVYQTDMSEYIKAGGACKCLTLRLNIP